MPVASIEQLKERTDLHELAEWLGMERPGGKGNYKAPWRKDKKPSLSIFAEGRAWKDHTDDIGGSCVDLVCQVKGCDVGEAIRQLHTFTGLPMDEPEHRGEARPKALHEWIAERCLGLTPEPPFKEVSDKARAYLSGRKISEKAIDAALKAKTLGFNTYTNPKVLVGEYGHGGEAVAFIARTLNPGHIAAVEMRYLDPDKNGGVKSQCQGNKSGHVWCSDYRKLKTAHTVYIVESPINALSIDSCAMPKGTVAIATMGKANIKETDWHFLHGKRVLICMDNDQNPDKQGFLPGPSAGWWLYEQLTGLNIAAMIVDQQQWEFNDVNDGLQAIGSADLTGMLRKTEPWAIPGVWGGEPFRPGKTRMHLPLHDFGVYFRYRAGEDFTRFIKKIETDEDGQEQKEYGDLCGFRVAAMTRVSVASSTSAMSGDPDQMPTTLFAVAVQVARHGPTLVRKVFADEQLHNVDQWRKFAPVWQVGAFSRMLNILERSAHLGERQAVNFVGLCWRNGKPIVNESSDCYFTEPKKQCPYHNLIFPSAPTHNAGTVIEAYQSTFGANAAAMMLIWSLGGHLKAFLGFWPHMIMQADKGSGKSTLIKRMERTIAMKMFSGQSLQTEFRLLTSIGHTSHPVGWEEISARRQDVIDKAVSMLQESYQFTTTGRGAELTEFMLSAPVLLAGEDVPVDSLTGKLVRTELVTKGDIMPDSLPVFPVRQWLDFLAGQRRDQVMALFHKVEAYCRDKCMAERNDSGAQRMTGNYAAVITAWRLLCEFAGIDRDQGGFITDTIAQMNRHIAETKATREPWVWILETVLSEISSGMFRHPFAWEDIEDESGEIMSCLCIRTSHIMDHMRHEMRLREKWNALPVKSDRVFKRQLKNAGVIINDRVDLTISSKRCCHLSAISIDHLAEYGLHADVPEEPAPVDFDD